MKVETKLLTIFGGIFFEWKIFGKECLWKTFGGKLLVEICGCKIVDEKNFGGQK